MNSVDDSISKDRRELEETNKRMKEYLDLDLLSAVGFYVLLDNRQRDFVRLQEYWPKLDEAIERGVYGQI